MINWNRLWRKPAEDQPKSHDETKYLAHRAEFQRALGGNDLWPFGNDYPILTDWEAEAGAATGHYFHQDLWAARKIFENQPLRHVDVGSRVDGFVAHVASFRSIDILDIRPFKAEVRGINFIQCDLMLPNEDAICDSLSCLHALEHFGLGRYGDQIDPWGYLKGFKNISSLVKAGGDFYFSVPIGQQRIEFNAHRVFGLDYILSIIDDHGFEIIEFSYVDDQGDLQECVELKPDQSRENLGLSLGCGLFHLRKSETKSGTK